MVPVPESTDYERWWRLLETKAHELGFQEIAVTDLDLGQCSEEYRVWLDREFHGEMGYMRRNASLRTDPTRLHPGTIRVISARMNYLSETDDTALADPKRGYVARYALGRDYHKVIRKRLARLAEFIQQQAGGNHRACVDSAPILEKPFAAKAGLGWVGKHTLLINERAGSYFFLGEILTTVPFPMTMQKPKDLCGHCKACITVCPTNAIVGPRQLDARRCISYLTIELKGPIPVEFREAIGNRVFGCDDCQIFCPWNRYAQKTEETDFAVRHGIDKAQLVELLAWTEDEFNIKTRGMAMRRINYRQWVRNLSVAAGNAPRDEKISTALTRQLDRARRTNDPMLEEHILWALERQTKKVA